MATSSPGMIEADKIVKELEDESRAANLLSKRATLEAQRKFMKQALASVEYQIIEVQHEYGSIFNKRSALLNLPIEVTCLIFRYALEQRVVEEDASTSSYDSEDDDEEDPLIEVVVSHVCHSWRSIALGYQQLWCRFWYNGAESERSQVDRFDAYMERSRNQPLHLWFEFRGEHAKIDHLPLVRQALRNVGRWERFTMFSENDPDLLVELTVLREKSAPLLTSFALYIDAVEEGAHDDFITSLETTILRGGAPKLTFILLDSSLAATLPPLDNITTLRIEKGDMTMYRWLPWHILIELLSLPTLVDVSLAGELTGEAPEDSLPVFETPQLQRLRFGGIPEFWPILQRMRAPQLHTLIIFGCDIPGAADGIIQSDNPYSFPSLRKLWLLETYAEFAAAQYLVKMTSAVKDVFITHDTFDLSFLATIITHLDVERIWPKLQTLTCNIQGVTDIVEYLQFSTRRPVCWRLHKELVTSWKHDEPEALRDLKRLAKIVELDEDFTSGSESFWPEDMDFPHFYIPDEDDHFAIETYL